MNLDTLKHNPDRVKRALVTKGNKVIAKEKVTIYIPEYFTRSALADIGSDIYIVGIFAMVLDDGSYAKSNTPAKLRISPIYTRELKIGAMDYLGFVFESGSTVIENTDLFKDNSLLYLVFNDILSKGRMPFQLSYDDVGDIFAKAKEFTGSGIMDNWEVMAILISMLARDPDDPNRQFRERVKSFNDADSLTPYWSPIRSVQFMATNTMSKLAGSYFSDGLVSALTTETKEVEPIESILRR